MSRLPIRLRITAAFAIAMAAVLAGSGVYLYSKLETHLELALDRDLELRAQDLAALIRQPRASLQRESAGRFVERGESYAQLLTADGRVLDATSPLGRSPLLSGHERGLALRRILYLDKPVVPGLNEGSRLLATAVTRNGQRLVLVVGATEQNDAETLSSFRDELLLAGPIALILASGVGYLLAGLSLRQVDSMRRRAAAISAATPGERLPVPPTGDELQRLGQTLNEMLARLEAALERERQFVADAGHELRTPLALLRTELELALRQAHTSDELREAVRRSSSEADRLCQLAEDMLLTARTEQGRLALRLETVMVDPLLASVQSRFDWRAEELGKRVRAIPAPGVSVTGDPLRLEQALANLVDNALRHGGSEITLSAEGSNGSVELHVRDDGDGIEPGFQARAFERFSRGDSVRAESGAGLGLAIVKTIAESHGGAAHLERTDPVGTDAWVALPGSP